MNTFDFKNRTAVITGGGKGFGLDIAKRFLDSGAKVIIWDIDEELLKSATNEVNNPNFSYDVIDVSNYSQIENTVIAITSKNTIDILLNNAGITGPTAPLWEYDVEMWNKIVQINLVGTFNVMRLAAELMDKNEGEENGEKGVIINTASIAGYEGQNGQSAYTASKAGVIGMTLNAARDLARHVACGGGLVVEPNYSR